MKQIALLAGLTALVACAETAPEWTRERQAAVTTHRMAGVAPNAAVKHAEKVLRLAARDTRFDYRPNGFTALRNAGHYMVFAATVGDFRYDVSARPASGGSIVSLKIYDQTHPVSMIGVTPTSPSLVKSAEAYRMFYDRMDYLAGLTSDWPECEKGKVETESMCLTASDRKPD